MFSRLLSEKDASESGIHSFALQKLTEKKLFLGNVFFERDVYVIGLRFPRSCRTFVFVEKHELLQTPTPAHIYFLRLY